MAGHGGGHETHSAHHGGAEQAGFFDLLFPISLAAIYTKNGLKDFIEGITDVGWSSGIGMVSDTPDTISELFGASGGGHGGGGGHGHGGGGGHGHGGGGGHH